MIIYFYLLIALKILTVESSSIRDRTLKNDLVSFLSSRADLGRKDSNSLKIISQEPFIIQLGVPNGLENVNTKDDDRERKRKRPAKKRFSKLRSLRKKHRIRRDVKASDYKRISNEDMVKSNQTERLMTDEAARDLLVNITSKHLAQDNSIKRQEMYQALTQVINETQQELDQRDSDLDKQIYEWIKSHADRKQSSHHQSSPMVGMLHQLPRKTDKNQSKYTYKDLMADRDRLEQKIKYLKNYMSSNDSKMADDGSRVRRKSESDKVNKMAKMFLTLSAVNGMNDRKKFKCKEEEEDDYDGDFWSEERRNSPMKRTSSTNEERYKVKKWIEHLKSKRSSRSSCPCQNNGHDDETDVFPLELKLSKGLSSRDYGENSEESSETYRGYPKFFDIPHGKTSRTSFYKPRYSFNNEEPDNKLSGFSKRGRRKFDLPLDDLETYRTRAKIILQNAEEILDKIKEEEEKRRTTPGCLANHLKELTSRIQGDPRNSENDLIKVLQKTLGWSPLTNMDEGTNEGGKDSDGGLFPHSKWSILDPYEKAKALTEENTRQLSNYLLRNLGKLGEQTTQQPQPEQAEESNPTEPEVDEKTQIYQGQVPQDKDSILSSDDLRRENVPDSDLNQLGQEIGDVPTMAPENKEDLLRATNLQEPIKDKIKEILEEQGKQIQELAGKQSKIEENPEDWRSRIVTLEDYLGRSDENSGEANPIPWRQSIGSPEENDEERSSLEQVEAVKGGEDENPTDPNKDDKAETVESKANTENDEKPTDPDQEEEETSKLQAPNKNFMDADPEDSKSGETTQDQVLQEKEALEGEDKNSDLDDDGRVEAVKGEQDDTKDDETLSDVNGNDKVEAALGEDNVETDEKTTELTEDDKVEVVKGKSNEEDVDPKDEDDKVEAINSKEKSADEEVEAVQGKSNEEADEDPKNINEDDKVEAVNSGESLEKTEDDEVEAVKGKSNEEDEETEGLNQEDKVEALRGKSNEEEDPEGVNEDDKVEAVNSKEKSADEEVEAVQGKSNEEADEDPKDVNEGDKVESINSAENSEKTEDDEVEAVQGKSNEEDENLDDLNQEDKVEAVQGREDTDSDEGLTDPNQKLRASKLLKKNFKNVNSDEKTEDYKGGENTQDPVVKIENEEERSSEDEDPSENVDFTNKETPKASSIEDEDTEQKDDESDVIGSQNPSKSEEPENQAEPDVAKMSNPEDSETSKLTNEDPTVAEPEPSNFEESSKNKMEPKLNDEDEADETNQDDVAAENPTSNKESDQEDPKDEEQIAEKDFAAAKRPTTSQENQSEDPDDPLTGKTSNSDEENSEADDRDENDLIASKHLKKANEQDDVPSTETGEDLKDNADDPLAKEHVSKTEEMIQQDSTESGSSSKETQDDDSQVGSEKVGKLDSTENDDSKSLETQGVGNVPDEKDSKTVGVPETDDQILEAQKMNGEDSLRAEGLARVIENILGKEESIPNQDGDDSKDEMIQSAPTTDENLTEDVVKEQPVQTHDSSTSGEVTPLLTYGRQQNEQTADPESSETSDELIESSQHNPELTSRENTKDEEWSIETGSPHHQTSEPSEENISEEPHLAKSINDEDWSPETETPHHQTSKSREPSEPNLGNPAGEYNSGSEEDLDYENPDDDTLRAANPIHDDDDPEDDMKHEDNFKATHSDPKNNKKIKLSVPRSVGDVIKDLNDGKIKYGDDMSSFDPEKIDYFIDKIDKAEQANDNEHFSFQKLNCEKECACANDIGTRARKIGRYEIVKDVLHWMKDLQLNRVLSDS